MLEWVDCCGIGRRFCLIWVVTMARQTRMEAVGGGRWRAVDLVRVVRVTGP